MNKGEVIKRLKKVSTYFKSMLKVGWQGDADVYREHRESILIAIAFLKEQPEVVRCKDCKYFNNHPMTHGLHYGECDNGIGMVNNNWFCADWERRKNSHLSSSEIPNS